MKEAIAKDIKERFDDDYHNVHICVAYTYDEAPALELKKELEEIEARKKEILSEIDTLNFWVEFEKGA